MISWACVLLGAILLWAGSLMLAYARGQQRDDYESPDPMGCRDCGTRDAGKRKNAINQSVAHDCGPVSRGVPAISGILAEIIAVPMTWPKLQALPRGCEVVEVYA